MRTSSGTPRQNVKPGDRVSFSGQVLRVLPTDERTFLVMVDATGVKLTIKAHWLESGANLRGSDPVTLTGTVTRVGDGSPEDAKISIAVDGFTSARVTLAGRWLTRAG